MLKYSNKIIYLVALIFFLQGQGFSHRMWLMPSATILSGNGQWVTIDGAISNDLFFPNHHPTPIDMIKAYDPDLNEVKLHNAKQGQLRSTFDIQLQREGTFKVQHLRRLVWANYQEKGKDIWWRGSYEKLLEQDFFKRKDLKLEDYLIKVETYVTAGEPTPIKGLPKAKGVTLIPTTHPNDYYIGEAQELQFVVEGKPLKDVEVQLVKGQDRYRDKVNELKLKTDQNGKIQFKLDEPGRYWLFLWTYLKPYQKHGFEFSNSVGYSLVFEVMPQ